MLEDRVLLADTNLYYLRAGHIPGVVQTKFNVYAMFVCVGGRSTRSGTGIRESTADRIRGSLSVLLQERTPMRGPAFEREIG